MSTFTWHFCISAYIPSYVHTDYNGQNGAAAALRALNFGLGQKRAKQSEASIPIITNIYLQRHPLERMHALWRILLAYISHVAQPAQPFGWWSHPQLIWRELQGDAAILMRFWVSDGDFSRCQSGSTSRDSPVAGSWQSSTLFRSDPEKRWGTDSRFVNRDLGADGALQFCQRRLPVLCWSASLEE